MMEYYKVTRPDGSLYYGHGKWHLPKGKKPGKWMPKITGDLIACQNGYHLCDKDNLIDSLGETIWIVEPKDEPTRTGGKILCRQARLIRKLETWNETRGRLFACDCAARSLRFFEKHYPKGKEMAAAWAAASDAAWAAAWAAASDAAWAAAWDAAWAAASDAARAAAWDAERKWQTKRLWKYLNGELPK